VSHEHAKNALLRAAETSGLTDCFMHVRELGDFAVTYRVAGLLEDIRSLISAKSSLLTAMLDALTQANIEVVSPNFMNTRQLAAEQKILPTRTRPIAEESAPTMVEDVAFDKAEDAASVEKIRTALRDTEKELSALKSEGGSDSELEEKAIKRKQDLLVSLLKNATEKTKSEP